MKLEEIESLWSEDAPINEGELGSCAADIPKLHYKYYKMLVREVLTLKKKSADLDILLKDKWMYYKGMMTKEELREHGWDQFDIKLITKEDVDRFMNSDKDIIRTKLEVSLIDEKVNYLKSIISSINIRNFIVRNMIEIRKFENGVV